MSSIYGSYVSTAYHGGKNEPEQVTEEFLTCRLCSEGFKRHPKILHCGHTFCQTCLEHYTGDKCKRIICCPTCARPTCMPETGVAGLANNSYVDCQIDRLLRRDNNANHRQNSTYNIADYKQDPFTNHAHFDEHTAANATSSSST